MSKSKPTIVWNGIKYSDASAIAEATGVSFGIVRYRIQQGYTRDADVPPVHPNHIPCHWNGIQYPSIRAAARACGILPLSMKKRLNNGYVCDADMRRTRKS